MTEKLLSYFNGDDLAASVWLGKYAQEGEETPDDMHKRLAKEFARIERNYQITEPIKISDLKTHRDRLQKLSEYGKIRKNLDEETIYNLFKEFKYIVPQGSIMSQLGSKSIGSLSNCFVIGQPEDSYGGIFQKDEEMAQLMKRRGGVGIDISTLRPIGTPTSNAAKSSTGAVSFMHRFSNTTREVAQNGRRGALMISIDINHPDVMEFIKIKRDLSQVTGANISIKINNDFMKAVENDEDYFLRFPCDLQTPLLDENLEYNILTNCSDIGYVKRIKAKEYWDEIIKSAHGVAEPGIIFIDNHHDYSPDGAYPQFKGVTTNPCFSGEMKLLTAFGYKKFKDLEGQEIDLIDHEGNVKEGRIIRTGEKPIFILKLSNGKTIETTIDHKFVTTNKEEVEAQYLKEGKHRLLIPYEINKEINEFTKYGFLQGDGCLGRLNSEKHLGLEIYIGEKDLDVAKIFDLNDSGKHYINGFNATLKELGFDSKQLPYRELPSSINYWEKDNLSMFLKGLWSANGSIIKGQRISFKSTCKSLIDNLKGLLKINYNIDSYITTNKAKNVQFSNGNYLCKESYDLNISKLEDVVIFAKEIGFIHEYKQNLLEELILTKCPLVISSKIGEHKEVFDFQINSDKHWGVVEGVVVHNCGEIFMQPYDACRLIALNLYSFVKNPFTKDAEFYSEKFYRIAYEAMRLSDDLIDLEIEHIDRILNKLNSDPESNEVKWTEIELWNKIKQTAQASRRTGLGFTALGDTLAALGYKYDSEEALLFIEQMMHVKMEAELDCTIDLAILRGTFEGWDDSIEYPEIEDSFKVSNEFYKMLEFNFPVQCGKMQSYGRRNVSWSTVAPTGTVSLLTQTTSGIEPIFSLHPYIRRKKINPNDKNSRVDFVDELGDSWQEFPIIHPQLLQYLKINNVNFNFEPKNKKEQDELVLNINEYLNNNDTPWSGSTANDIDWVKRVEMQSIIQKYTTHSISSTINLPNNVSEKEVSKIYLESWKKGLKGITVYRDGSRSGVLVSTETNANRDTFEYVDAVKRPKVLEAEVHLTKVAGKPYYVVVGMMDNKPYEVFINNSELPLGKGEVVKKNKSVYEFRNNDYHQIISSNMTDEQLAITRLTSGMLRHGADIKFIVEQLNKCDGDLFSFTKGLARVLKKFIPDGTKSTVKCHDCGSENVIFEEGCNKCLDCGSSKCG